MPQTTTTPQEKARHIGKDELNLADWRIGVPTHQQPRKENGEKLDVIEYEIPSRHGRTQRVTLMAPSAVGLPTPTDEDLLIGLLYLAKRQRFEADVVRFSTSQLCEVMHKVPNQAARDRIEQGLTRLKALTVKYEFAWYDRLKAKVEPVLVTGILAEARLMRREGRPRKDEPHDSYVQWTNSFYKTIRAGNLTDLDLDLYFSFSRPGTKQLYRHLNKRFHGPKTGVRYERDLVQLACGHLGMKRSKYLKRNLDLCIQELEQHGYILAEEPARRYRRVRAGVWRVGFMLAPPYRTSKRKGHVSHIDRTEMPGDDAAARLVHDFHRMWSRSEEYSPGARELAIAKRLLESYDSETIAQALPHAVKVLKIKWPNCKTFKGVESYIDDALRPLADQRRREQARRQAEEEAATHSQQQADTQRRNAELNQIWENLSASQQKKIRALAVRGHPVEVLRKMPNLAHSMCLTELARQMEMAGQES